MFDFLKTVAKAAFDTAMLPVEVIKDVATLGGVNTDQPEPYTVRGLKRIADDFEEMRDDLSK